MLSLFLFFLDIINTFHKACIFIILLGSFSISTSFRSATAELSPYVQSADCRVVAMVYQFPSFLTILSTSWSLTEFAVETKSFSLKRSKRLSKFKNNLVIKKEWQQTHFKNWEYSSESKGFQINIALPAVALPDSFLLPGLLSLNSRTFWAEAKST